MKRVIALKIYFTRYGCFLAYYETQGVQARFLGAVVPQWNSISLSAFCEEMSPDSKHARFIYGGALECMRVLQETSSYKAKNATRGCARICLEDILRTKFGAAKCASALGKCNVAERACTLCCRKNLMKCIKILTKY